MRQSQINQQASLDNCGALNGLLPWPAHTTSRFIHLEQVSPHLHLLHSCPLLYTRAYCQARELCFKTLLQAFCSRTSLQDLPQDFIQALCFKTSFRDLPQLEDLVQVFCSETSLFEDLPPFQTLLQELHLTLAATELTVQVPKTKIASPFTTQIVSGTRYHSCTYCRLKSMECSTYRDNCHRAVLQQDTKSLETKTRFQAGQK
ncbi:hypothetical protein B0H11DRAFT_2138364 [Mycena galericulata]|nr:hypothetical protein B0H11DRAFT_2138364 [Mycena galericulata]